MTQISNQCSKKLKLQKVLQMCSQSVFLCGEKVYKQIDSVAMGSPLAPILASKENYQLQTNSKTKPVFYTRYVDDIFAVTHNNTDLTNFYHEMNTLHTNLEFTLERSINGKQLLMETTVSQH